MSFENVVLQGELFTENTLDMLYIDLQHKALTKYGLAYSRNSSL